MKKLSGCVIVILLAAAAYGQGTKPGKPADKKAAAIQARASEVRTAENTTAKDKESGSDLGETVTDSDENSSASGDWDARDEQQADGSPDDSVYAEGRSKPKSKKAQGNSIPGVFGVFKGAAGHNGKILMFFEDDGGIIRILSINPVGKKNNWEIAAEISRSE